MHAYHTLYYRLENGLNKLHSTQSEVDVLVENARAMALQVEAKVANANVFAEQVRGLEVACLAHQLKNSRVVVAAVSSFQNCVGRAYVGCHHRSALRRKR